MTASMDLLPHAPDFSELPEPARSVAIAVNRRISLAAKPATTYVSSWNKEDDEAFVSMLAPDWAGLAHASGRKAAMRLIQRAPYLLLHAGDIMAHPIDFHALAGALGRLGSADSPLGLSTKGVDAIARSCANVALHLFICQGGAGNSSHHKVQALRVGYAAVLIKALIGVISPEARSDMAGRLLPLYALKFPADHFYNLDATRDVYGALFAHGVELNDVFCRHPTPKASVSEQIKRIFSKMAPDGLAPLFEAEFDRKDLSINLARTPEAGASMWGAKGLSDERLASLLNLVELIEADHPGEGAQRAIAWLQTHPSARRAVQSDRAKEAEPTSRGSRARRM